MTSQDTESNRNAAEPRTETVRHPLIEAHRLSVLFPLKKRLFAPPRFLHAVDDVSMFIRHGETLGLVGESGCGKTTLARALLRLVDATYGRVLLEGRPIHELPEAELRPLRRKMQMVFQDPLGAMDPRLTVERIVAEGIEIHGLGRGKKQTRSLVVEKLEEVGLGADLLKRFPMELSGGERQRVGIARALAIDPSLLVCDEPVASLDVSIQGQVLELLLRLQKKKRLSYLFISHDIGVQRMMSHRLAVMYMGRIVEQGPTAQVISSPKHPYTKALMAAVPSVDPAKKKLRVLLQGEPPDPAQLPTGCSFHARCPHNDADRCERERPELKPVDGSPEHRVACWHADAS